jgi:DNA mismatch repair protein MutL
VSDIIQLLPDSVANQIAAGEVIQRPASLLKELMENAIDAGADEITVIIKDAGRTLVQVIDNGSGMSETDARMSFERHATSKIKTANDLFAIKTMGFRGEALASIAAVAHVELTTKTQNAELGTKIVIAGSKVEQQTPVACQKGSSFSVKNLFFNIPARRKFLKPDAAEMRNIITEFKRVVMTNKDINFKLYHNDVLLFNLPATNLMQRITNTISRKAIQAQLIPVNVDTTIIKIYGFTGNPQNAKKSGADQYFFVNNRFMQHPYFHRAVVEAYSKLIPADTYPSYFIYFEINPDLIDINRNPTKTQIKFDDESTIWKILNAAVRESLGKFNAVPSIDFDTEGIIEIPVKRSGEYITSPKIHFNPDYNPFEIKK